MTDIDERVQKLVRDIATRGAEAPWRIAPADICRSISPHPQRAVSRAAARVRGTGTPFPPSRPVRTHFGRRTQSSGGWPRGMRRALIGMAILALITSAVVVGLDRNTGDHSPSIGGLPQLSSALASYDPARSVPAGWHQIDFGLAQIAVPSGWLVHGPDACAQSDGRTNELLVDLAPDGSACDHLPTVPGRSVTFMWLVDATEQLTGPPSRTVNGFRLYAIREGRANGFVVPQLGMELFYIGADPEAVIRTLAWSPLAVVLAPGPRTNSSFWRTLSFHGVNFDVPSSWRVYTPMPPDCFGDFAGGSDVGLGRSTQQISCPGLLNGLNLTRPLDGVVLVAGNDDGTCILDQPITIDGQRVDACGADDGYQTPRLDMLLTGPSGTVTFELALGPTGQTAREILGSIRVG
jgi:hypothetical protein